MSLSALIWASQLPLDLGIKSSEAAFRVLLKLADAHHDDTGAAYRDVDRMALELGCSARTVQRALRQLEQAGLVARGDQGILPANVRRDRRPTVYRLPLASRRRPLEQPQLDGVTTGDTPSQPVDNVPRGDRHAVDGVTPVVALGTGEQVTNYPARPQYARPCTDGTMDHAFSASSRQCVYCHLDAPAGALFGRAL